MISCKACLAVTLAAVMLVISGCKQKEAQAAVILDEASIKETVVVAQPQEAVDKIYDSLKEYKASKITSWQLDNDVGIKESDVVEFYGKISNPSGGLADVFILMPKKEKREDVRLALSKYKEKRIAEFENYDILDAYPISQGAVIYDQGEYLIMLMLADNDAAREIIDEYIPL